MARKSKESTDQAEKKKRLLQSIKQAAQEGATYLDLSSWGISELPEEIGQLTSLQLLNLNSNQLTSLPELHAPRLRLV